MRFTPSPLNRAYCGHGGKSNTCAQSVPKKFRDRSRADKTIEKSTPPNRFVTVSEAYV